MQDLLKWLLEALAAALDHDWPRWIGNVANIVQLLAALFAIWAWTNARRVRR